MERLTRVEAPLVIVLAWSPDDGTELSDCLPPNTRTLIFRNDLAFDGDLNVNAGYMAGR